MITRRELLWATAAAACLPRQALGFGPTSQVDVAELDLGPGTTSRPDAWERILNEVEITTSVETSQQVHRVDPGTPDLFLHPFSVLSGDGEFAMPSDAAVEQLSRYLAYGGFLFIDDATGSDASGFDRSVRQLCDMLFPTKPLAPLPSDHSLYRAFFLIQRPVGRVAKFATLEGITLDGVEGKGGYSPLIYSRNDVTGALDRAATGLERNACTPGGENQRREAVKLGVNLFLYCITTDYKKDQAHVKKLLEDHRLNEEWEPQ